MHIVLVQPEIPQNTGSIARTCAATRTALHLIEPLGFEISDKTVRRAGLDYWPHVELYRHKNFEEYLSKVLPKRTWFLSKFGTKPYFHVNFQNGDALIFGSETKGLGEDFLQMYQESVITIPMINPAVRSLNLSNAVSIVLYEGLRQLTALHSAP